MKRVSSRMGVLLAAALALLAAFLFVNRVQAQDLQPTSEPNPLIEPEDGSLINPVEVEISQENIVDPAPDIVPAEPQAIKPLVIPPEDAIEVVPEDPYFMVGLSKYMFVISCPGTLPAGVVYCESSGTPVQAALSYIESHGLLPTDGNVHVENGAYAGNTSITGSGVTKNLKGIVSENGAASTILNGDVSVSNTLLGFTLQGFTINGGISFTSNTGPLLLKDLDVQNLDGTGIVVNQQRGSITLNCVESSENGTLNVGDGSGAILSNNMLGTTNPVTVINSEFDDNEGENYDSGLDIRSNGLITINGVSASRNYGDGLNFTGLSATVKNSIFDTNTNIGGWGGTGLYFYSINTGGISMENVETKGNTRNGIDMNPQVPFPVNLKNVISSDNGWDGLSMGYMQIDTSAPFAVKSLTVINSTFNNNGGNGIFAWSRGPIILATINANDNAGSGADLDTCLYYDSDNNGIEDKCLGTGTVTLSSLVGNGFNNNGNIGLNIHAGGLVTISDFDAGDNGWSGIEIINDYPLISAGVTIKVTIPTTPTTNWYNSANSNTASGLWIESNGPISMDKTWAEMNGQYGAMLRNRDSITPQPVTVTASSFNGNNVYGFGYDGLYISSKGLVTLKGVTADGNTVSDYTVSDIDYTLSSGWKDRSIHWGSVKNAYTFFSDGSYLNITLNAYDFNRHLSLEHWNDAMQQWDEVASNENCNPDEPWRGTACLGADTVSGDQYRIWIGSDGGSGSYTLFVNSDWATGLLLDSYSSNGIRISTRYAPAGFGNVIIQSLGSIYNSASYNSNDGLQVYANGTITISNFDGVDGGIYLDNSFMAGKAVKLTSVHLESSRLQIQSQGSITLTDVKANGAYLDNTYSTTPQAISVTKGTFQNELFGLWINTAGAVSLNTVVAEQNWDADASICQHTGHAYDTDYELCVGPVASVTMTGSNRILSDWWDTSYYSMNLREYGSQNGLVIWSKGNVTLSNLIAGGAQNYGIYITTDFPGSVANVIINATLPGFQNESSNNGETGLYVASRGTISVDKMTANNNGLFGAFLWNDFVPGKTVSVSNSFFNNNARTDYCNTLDMPLVADGLKVLSLGGVTLKGVEANGNSVSEHGIDVGTTVSDFVMQTPTNMYDSNYADYWNFFVMDTIDVDIRITSSESVWAYPNLYLWNEPEQQWDYMPAWVDCPSGEMYCLYATLTAGNYRIEVNAGNTSGHYYLSLNDPTNSNVVEYLSNGIVVDNGASPITVLKGTAVGANTSGNNGIGLWAYTTGNVTLNNVIAENNSYGGVIGDISGAVVEKHANVVLINNSQFNSNQYRGLAAWAVGKITWNGGTASNNLTGSGAKLWNYWSLLPQAVSVSGVVLDNNGFDGLGVLSNGAITLTNVSASGNSQFGAVLDNCNDTGLGCTAPLNQPILVGGTGSKHYDNNGVDGLHISANGGAVTLTGFITASNNGYNVVGSLYCPDPSLCGYGVYIQNDFPSSSGNVTVTGILPTNRNQFWYNVNDALHIETKGAVTVSNSRASLSDSGYGVFIDSHPSIGVKTVTLTYLTAGMNNQTNIYVNALGPVTLNYVMASGSSNGNGVTIYNNAGGLPPLQNVTITRSEASGNNRIGFEVYSKGVITLNGDIANGNGDNGAYLDNVSSFNAGLNVLTTMGPSTFNNNVHGLEIYSHGLVTVTGVMADENSLSGGIMINDPTVYSLGNGNVVLTNVTTRNNVCAGIFVATAGNITISNAMVRGNGIGLGWEYYMTPGILAYTSGSANTVSILSSTAIGNGGHGIWIVNPRAPLGVVLTGTNYMGNNVDMYDIPSNNWQNLFITNVPPTF